MEEYREKWQQCLRMIREKMNDDHAFSVWYGDIVLEQYDPQTNTLLLQVPSHYVYEYIEQCGLRLMAWALKESFGVGASLRYRIVNEPAVAQAVDFPAAGQMPRVAVTGARGRLENGLRHYLGDRAQWLPCYDRIAEWLSDNKGRGLLCIGTSGLGKTLICEKILPVILGRKIKTVNATDMASHIDELMKERAVIIDDLGKEPAEYKSYGNVRKPFFELCDAAERNGILLIVTSNLSTNAVNNPLYPDSIERRYGREVLSRLRATVHAVRFEGADLRA